MGKLKCFVSLLMAAGMFAACSDNFDEGKGNNSGNALTGEKGYVNIGINLPTTSSSRALDGYDDGTPDEYKVNEVIIALFYGINESEAVCKHAFKINGEDFVLKGENNDNVTTYSASGVRMISAPESGQTVYALALVNPPSSVFELSSIPDEETKAAEENADAVLTTTLSIKTDNDIIETINLETLQEAVSSTLIKDDTGYFFMSNAPIAVGVNELTSQTLAPITVYQDKNHAEGAAKDNPVYVERAAAKVSVNINDNDNDNTLTVTNKYPSYDGATVKFDGWTLQNTNITFLPVRSVRGFTDWSKYSNRFISTSTDPCRIFWAEDNNYDKKEEEDNKKIFNIISLDNSSIEWTAPGISEYCAENTTTAENMTTDKLTSVLLKGQFKLKDGTYNDNLFTINNNTSLIYSETKFFEWVKSVLTEAGLNVPDNLSIDNTVKGSVITNYVQLKKLLKINGDPQTDLEDSQLKAIIQKAGNNIKYYKGGVTYYYAAVIKHFGDEETPYDDTGENVTYKDEEHLGRFGVVRNTWYELTIKSVSGPGEPSIPEIPTTPPDKKDNYINCEINILSWAKRTQGVDL